MLKVSKLTNNEDLFEVIINKYDGLKVVESKTRQFIINWYSEKICIIDVEAKKVFEYPVEKDFEYIYKIYKRPKKITARDGVAGLRKFMTTDVDFWSCHIKNILSLATGVNLNE